MELQLKGKKAFISGSTEGIGYDTALQLLKEGVHVIINGRQGDKVEAAVEALQTAVPTSTIKGIACDFSVGEEVENLLGQLDNVDILINNVGIYQSKSFFHTSDQSWFHQFEVNIMSGVRLSRHFLPQMMATGWGRILFVSSECASLVPPDLIPYSATKSAVLAISRGLAQLTRGSKVTVNALLPGSTLTEGAQHFLKSMATETNRSVKEAEKDFFKKERSNSLIGRFAKVEEISNTILYYASPLSSATNGAAIKIEGGSMGGIL